MIIRSKRATNFTVIDNKVFERGFLSYQARGLLCTILSYPDDWKINVQALIKEVEGTDKESGETVIYNTLKALRNAGYVQLIKHSDGSVDYIVYDNPNPDFRKQVETQSGVKPNPENPNLETPNLEKPDLENHDVLINTKTTTRTIKRKQELNIAATSEDVTATYADTQNLPAKKTKTPDPDNIATWNAYNQAYVDRYGVEPIRNAKTNGQIASLVKSVGGDIAPILASYYLKHNGTWFTQRRHDLGLLLQNYQQVYTDMQRNEQMTLTKSRQQEKTQNMGQVANSLIARYEKEAAI